MKTNKLSLVIVIGLFASAAFASPLMLCQGDGLQLTLDFGQTQGTNVSAYYQGRYFGFTGKIHQFNDALHTRAGLGHVRADLPSGQYVSLLEESIGYSGTAVLDMPNQQEVEVTCGDLYTPPAHPHCPRCELDE